MLVSSTDEYLSPANPGFVSDCSQRCGVGVLPKENSVQAAPVFTILQNIMKLIVRNRPNHKYTVSSL